MSGKNNSNSNELTQPEFRVAPITAYGSFDNYLEDTEKFYGECEEAFLASDVRAADFPETCEKWAAAARTMIMAAGALFGRHSATKENKTKALEMFDRCKKDSGLRAKNLKLHHELAKQDGNVGPKELAKKARQFLAGLEFFFRAEGTQQSYLKRYVNSPDFVDPEYQILLEQAPIARKYRKMIPAGHYFMPARPYPPERVPDWMKEVPFVPEPFRKWKDLPPEDFIYDEEHDEFVLPKGYVSADGTIDDQSVVFDWDKRTVTCRFVGGEPVTWPFWKPRDTTEAPKRGTWFWDYQRQVYKQVLRSRYPAGYFDP